MSWKAGPFLHHVFGQKHMLDEVQLSPRLASHLDQKIDCCWNLEQILILCSSHGGFLLERAILVITPFKNSFHSVVRMICIILHELFKSSEQHCTYNLLLLIMISSVIVCDASDWSWLRLVKLQRGIYQYWLRPPTPHPVASIDVWFRKGGDAKGYLARPQKSAVRDQAIDWEREDLRRALWPRPGQKANRQGVVGLAVQVCCAELSCPVSMDNMVIVLSNLDTCDPG